MRLSPPTLALLGLIAINGHAYHPGDSNITFYGAPRASLDGVLPVLSIEEDYIRSQTDHFSNKAFGAAGELQCSASSPCVDGSCCNSQGQCGFRDEHCKDNCVANCGATAPCGQNSKEGKQKCPLNVCCSYFGFCGATDSFCRDTTDAGQSTPCQTQFGKCGSISPPSCGAGSGTALRRVAYYEGWNTRRRPCDKVFPQNMDTTGLTHLIFSFATIDPSTFGVGPMHPDDEKLYEDFFNLEDGSQKWIGIGGWEFSDTGATRYTWSQMASTKTNRAAFISSLQQFLEKWSFRGVDIDWEWPGAESRGGNPAIDMRNQIDLMIELRQALGSRGLSLVLPAQYEYLKHLDPKALEAQVDHFNVLSYDLHGPWDATVPGEGALIKPHTDLKEIDTALNLFWFNDVNPAKINLGVANYGRGYTVADPSCSRYGCAWTGPSKAGECTQLEGVLSQCEIQRLIRAKNLNPQIIAGGAGVKQISFDGQWVGYDDSETLELKIGLANDRCLGGTALWAIDYASCGGGPGGPGAPLVSSPVLASSASGGSGAPSSMAPSAPATSPEPATSPGLAASSTSPPVSGSSAASSVSPPAQSSWEASSALSSTPGLTSATKTETESSAMESSMISTTAGSSGFSVPAQSPPDASTSTSISATTSETESSAVSSTSGPVVPSSGSSGSESLTSVSSASASLPSQFWSSSPDASPSSVATSSGTRTASTSQLESTTSPVVTVTSSGSWQSWQTSAATTVVSSASSSASQSPSMTASQDSSTVSLSSSSSMGSSAWTDSTKSSSVFVSLDSSSAAGSSSQTTAERTSDSQTSSVTTSNSGISTSAVSSGAPSTTGISSSWISASTITTGTTSGWSSGSVNPSPSTGTSSEQSSVAVSSGARSSQSLSVTTATATSWVSSLSQATTTTTRDSSQSTGQSSGTATGSASSSQDSNNVVTSGTPSASSALGTSSTAATSGASSASDRSSSNAATSDVLSWASTTVVSRSASDPTTSNPAQTSSPSSQSSGPPTMIISNPTASTSNAAGTRSGGGGSIATKSSGQGFTFTATPTSSGIASPMPTGMLREICPKCSGATWCSPLESLYVNKLPVFPPAECLDNEWCTKCWPKPPEFNMEICPLECWLLDWCRPLCRPVDKLPIEPPEKGLKLPWFLTWWWKLPVKDCVPNDCKAECFAWYGLSLAIFKRPICPCVPRTCTKGEDKENKDKKKCKLFGCGCGWMGLPLGPGCVDIQVDFPKIFPFGVFGQNPCKWFGGCKPGPGPKPGPPPEDDNPNDDDFGDEGCGPFGCRGYCYVEGGCEPCPREICGGPKCTKPGGCGPKTGPDPMPEPTRKSKCEEDQKTTVTERIVSCFVDLKVEPTTIMSINYTLTETLTSACLSFEATYTGCGILGTTTTTTVSSFTSTSSEAPACTRAPLDLDNDEGDNAQPTKTTDGPSCTRAPLMLDDDEGDNEQPKSSEAPACTRAPLSLDDDEGNNEMPADMSSSLSVSRSPTPSANSSSIALSSTANSSSIASSTMSMTSSMSPNSSSSSTSRVLPPSTLSMPTTTPPWGSGIPSGTPTPGNCGGCKSYFDVIANGKCRPDGSDAEACAKWSLAELCFGNRSPDYCKTGPCKHSACPKENLGDYSKANPASPFTTVLSLSSTTVSVTATPSKTTVSLSASATPTCKSGGSISPHGKWTAYWEQVNYGDQYSDFTWTLWDENGCEAGKGSANNRQLLGADIVTDIGAQGRPQEQKMGYMLHANTTDSTAESRSEIQFTISKPPAGCTEFCWVKWKITNGIASKPWEITDDCAQQCGMRKLTPTDVGCDDGINKFQTADDDSLNKRGGYCWWRMPFEPANDDPVPPPPPPPPPSPPITRESIWRLEIRQQMEHEKSEVEWTLYDPNKNHAGSGLADTSSGDVVKTIIETQGRDEHPEDKLKYKMQLTVSHPRNKDKSTVKIAYADVGKLPGCKYGTKTGHVPSCNPSYETETDDEANVAILMDCYTKYYGTEWACDRHLVSSTQMSCDPIPHAFRPKNAGFERSFACWWPHDFAPSPGSGGGRALW